MAAVLLRATRLAKAYPGPPAFRLQVPELALEEGAATLLCGPNGAGKSTLLRAIAGLETVAPDAQFAWRGQPNARPALGKDSAYLHQDPYVFKSTALANVAYASARCRQPQQQAMDSLRWAGLGEYASTPARRLSGGQQRRLALARIHAMPASLLLLDEPTAQLDEQGTASVARLIGDLAAAGRTVLAATHDDRLAARLPAARRLAIEAGMLQAGSSGN